MRNLIIISAISIVVLSSCKESTNQENTSTSELSNSVLTTTYADKSGKTLEVTYDFEKEIATVNFNGTVIALNQQKTASGSSFRNQNYELTGKGNNIQLTQNGTVVFSHEDNIINTLYKGKEGETLHITFNNTTNLAKAYLNEGEQIDLIGQKPASGIWFKNTTYELRGKGDYIELTKNGKSIFKVNNI
jgi:membrane-bound inhibitor of C-type lysozyme